MLDRIARVESVRLIAAAVALVLTGPAPGAGLRAQVIDQATLAVLRGADTIGLETFTVTASPQGFEIAATAYYPPHRPAITIGGTLRIGLDSLPSVVSIENVRGTTRRVMAQFAPRRMTFRRMSERGESAREYPGASRVMVVFDSLVAFSAIPPQVGEGPVTVVGPATDYRRVHRWTDWGEEPMRIAGVRVLARHFVLTVDDQVRHFWYYRDRLQRVELPDRGIVVERLPASER